MAVIVCDLDVDKKKIKMRVASKKKRPAETCVEKCNSSPSSELNVSSSSLNASDLSELQQLLTQKRAQLAMQEQMTAAVASSGDTPLQQMDTVPACTSHALFISQCSYCYDSAFVLS